MLEDLKDRKYSVWLWVLVWELSVHFPTQELQFITHYFVAYFERFPYVTQ